MKAARALEMTLLQQRSTHEPPSPRPGFISRAYRDMAAVSGAAFTTLFIVLALWMLLLSPTSIGGAGGGEGGGRGSGAGGGIGDGRGPGAGGGLGAASGAGGDGSGGQDGSGGVTGGATHADATPTDDASEAGDRAPTPASDDSSMETAPRRPPLRIGFTAAPEEPTTPEPIETPASIEPTNRAGAAPAGAGGRAGGGGGGDDAPSFMGVRGRGHRIVYVIDRSGSMASNQRFAHARYELKQSIRALPEEGEFLVIYFDTTALPMPGERLVRSSRSNVDRYTKWIDQQQPGGGTDPTEAMEQALALAPDTIFLLSDGIFEDAIAGRIRAANTGHCSICTIAFHDATGEAILQRIARENEGTYRFVPPP